eukprot:scaffold4061_cov108-Cylindrotheca_fusiformis.AAC.4
MQHSPKQSLLMSMKKLRFLAILDGFFDATGLVQEKGVCNPFVLWVMNSCKSLFLEKVSPSTIG